ncbi:MAG: hypothetical protein KDJ36_06020, partial [Hyphomicrobiaceae bacterium]|nr:hypothetical protein [Hyphomicrobiaceae bacterium]
VSVAQSGPVTCLVYGRIMYRRDLLARAGLSAADVMSASDADLVLGCYRARGSIMLGWLEGDFSVVIIDRVAARVFGVRDPMGGYPLYWTAIRDVVGITTALRPLDALQGGAIPNDSYLGNVQMLPFFETDHTTETAFRGISRVLPGTMIEVDMRTSSVTENRLWDWSERQDEAVGMSLDDAAARFRELLDASIAERLRGNVAAHLSGGMDSTAIALLAHQRLAADNRPLQAMTVTYEKLHGLAGEGRYIDAVKARPGLEWHRFSGDDILDFDHFDTATRYDEPYPGFFRAAMNQELVGHTVAAGADTVLTGMGADELTANAPFQIADDLRAGRLRVAWREAGRWATAGSRSTWSIFAPFGIEPLIPARLRGGLLAALNNGYAFGGRGNAWTIPPWIKRSFARSGRLQVHIIDHLSGLASSRETVVMSFAHELIRLTAGDWVRANIAAPLGLHVTHPFRDPRLIRHALGVRASIPPVPGEQKALLARATADILPEAIARRREKGNFNAVYFKGLQRNLPALERLIDDTAGSANHLFDPGILRERLRDAALGVDDVRRVHGLNNSLAILHWLRQLPDWRSAEIQRTPLKDILPPSDSGTDRP